LGNIHEKNIVHRDLRLENIFIDNEGIIKIGGFGLAIKIINDEKPLKEKVGSPDYMSPEMINPSRSSKVGYGQETDIWSAGIVLYAMIYGRMPFSTKNEN
jgi:serine/threonine protein kinase